MRLKEKSLRLAGRDKYKHICPEGNADRITIKAE
jgi:hypothetical protein